MDFIERFFGMSPDGGSGTFELVLIALPLFLITVYTRFGVSRLRG